MTRPAAGAGPAVGAAPAGDRPAAAAARDHWVFGPWLWAAHFAMIAGFGALVNLGVLPWFTDFYATHHMVLPAASRALVSHPWAVVAPFLAPVLLYRPIKRLHYSMTLVAPSVLVAVYAIMIVAALALPLARNPVLYLR